MSIVARRRDRAYMSCAASRTTSTSLL